MNFHKVFIALILFFAVNSFIQAQDSNKWSSGRADGHAPIGVMGDHTHNKGEFMISYRYMYMQMEGMRAGTEALVTADVISAEGSNYLITPLNMPMGMHMVGLMYALTDNVTLMGMANFSVATMDHQTRMGGMFTTGSSGFGDLRIGSLIKVLDKNNQRLHANIALSIPTGSIDQMDITPASAPNESLLPYPMQIGSGTFDILPGLTYLLQGEKTSIGAQVLGTIRLGENERTYTQSQQANLTVWGAYKFVKGFSTSLRVNAAFKGEIQGTDPSYDMMVMNRMVPTVFPANSGGTVVSTGLGTNFYISKGPLKNVRLAVEGELPVYRNLNGTQLETDLMLTFGLQYSL